MGLQISSQHALEKLYSLCKVCGSLVRNSRIKNHLRKEHLFNDVISKEKTFLSMKKFFSNNTSDSKMDTTDAEQKIAEEIYFNEINGKGSEDKNFKQAEKEIYCYLNFLGERNFTLKQVKCHSDITRLSEILKDFLFTEYCRKFKARTRKHYLNNIKRFTIIYLTANKPMLVPVFKEKMIVICKKINNQCSLENFENKERKKENSLTVELFQKFFECDLVKCLENKFEEIMLKQNITENERKLKTSLIAFLALTLSFTNFLRPCNLTNLKASEFEKAEGNGDNTIISVQVKQHKTKKKYGSAYIHMTEKTYKLMQAYKQFFRVGDVDNFFINSNGDAYTTPALLRITKDFWKRTNISNFDFSFGKVRHAIVTHIHAKNPEFKESLAEQMNHSSATASKFYKDFTTTKVAQENFQKFYKQLHNAKKQKKITNDFAKQIS